MFLAGEWREEYEWMMDYCTVYSQTIEHRSPDIALTCTVQLLYVRICLHTVCPYVEWP